MKNWLYAAAGILLAVGFAILGGPGKAAIKARSQRDDLLLDGSAKAKAKAEQLNIKANTHQSNAAKAAKIGQASVDKVGTDNETVSDILDSWRKPGSV